MADARLSEEALAELIERLQKPSATDISHWPGHARGLLTEAADALVALTSWRSITEAPRHFPTGEDPGGGFGPSLLLWRPGFGHIVGCWFAGRWSAPTDWKPIVGDITHWMHLPTDPTPRLSRSRADDATRSSTEIGLKSQTVISNAPLPSQETEE